MLTTRKTRRVYKIRTYSKLSKLRTFQERFDYLKLDGNVAEETFGFDRYLNQKFYHSIEWKRVRDYVIVRDCGCDLGIADNPIRGRVYIHHMNPLTIQNLRDPKDAMLDPEYLICVSHDTHNAIHYGSDPIALDEVVERRPNDTCPWKN